MPSFRHGEVEIAYLDEGQGEPIVLVHGFASTKEVNWVNPGWVRTLTGAARRAIALDNRGHGASSTLYDPADYAMPLMADDVRALLDHLGIERADVMGYSMGGILTVSLLMTHGDRVSRAVVAGVGATYFASRSHRKGIAAALRASDPSTITDATHKAFRAFASQGGKDLLALAACMSADRTMYTAEQLRACATPVLVVAGENDVQSGAPEPLAQAFADGRAVVVPRRDHMTAVGDKVYKQAVLEFLG